MSEIATVNMMTSYAEVPVDSSRSSPRFLMLALSDADLEPTRVEMKRQGTRYRTITRTVSALGVSFAVRVLVTVAGKVEEKPAAVLTLNEWLDGVHRIKTAHTNPAHYWSKGLGNPKFENGIDKLCYEKGMTPQEALDWWCKQ